jgi:hypothetical protein
MQVDINNTSIIRLAIQQTRLMAKHPPFTGLLVDRGPGQRIRRTELVQLQIVLTELNMIGLHVLKQIFRQLLSYSNAGSSREQY